MPFHVSKFLRIVKWINVFPTLRIYIKKKNNIIEIESLIHNLIFIFRNIKFQNWKNYFTKLTDHYS